MMIEENLLLIDMGFHLLFGYCLNFALEVIQILCFLSLCFELEMIVFDGLLNEIDFVLMEMMVFLVSLNDLLLILGLSWLNFFLYLECMD